MTNRLRALFCDHLSMMRGKYLPASKIGDDASRFAQALFAVHYDRDLLLDAPGARAREGCPDMELRWQAADIRDSWENDDKIVLGDLCASDGTPLPLCPRGALKRAVADWEATGLRPKVGIELEAFALQQDEDGKWVPYDTPGAIVYGTGPFADPAGFNDQIWEMADRLGFRLDLITSEYDTPQFEYTLSFDDALQAVDDIVLFRQMAREIAFDHGILLSFLPKPIAEAGGSGMHINFSFTDGAGNNAITSNDGELNALASGCVAGLLHHHKGLAGLIAPTVNSYERLQPGALAGYWQNWAHDHRNVTVRTSTSGAKARLEHRMADASANPYTATAAVLQAARLGVANGYALPPMETGDGFEVTDAATGVGDSLSAATADLKSDGALAEAIGAELVANHAYMKEIEVEKTAEMNDAEKRDFYLNFI